VSRSHHVSSHDVALSAASKSARVYERVNRSCNYSTVSCLHSLSIRANGADSATREDKSILARHAPLWRCACDDRAGVLLALVLLFALSLQRGAELTNLALFILLQFINVESHFSTPCRTPFALTCLAWHCHPAPCPLRSLGCLLDLLAPAS